MATKSWGTDTIISMPSPLRPGQTPIIDMGMFTFTTTGIAHNFTVSDLEAYLYPTYLPPNTPQVAG
jgi:hypothetical protein